MYAGESARLCNMLQLHQASTSSEISAVDREHRKRVWWSTYCLDKMTSSQRGLLPSLQLDQTNHPYPTQANLPSDAVGEFAEGDYLTARIQLTILQANNSKGVSNFGKDDANDIRNILRPMLRRLESWKTGLPAHLAIDMDHGLVFTFEDLGSRTPD